LVPLLEPSTYVGEADVSERLRRPADGPAIDVAGEGALEEPPYLRSSRIGLEPLPVLVHHHVPLDREVVLRDARKRVAQARDLQGQGGAKLLGLADLPVVGVVLSGEGVEGHAARDELVEDVRPAAPVRRRAEGEVLGGARLR
jgi:hypothetical protein